jgi:hypothetical protein
VAFHDGTNEIHMRGRCMSILGMGFCCKLKQGEGGNRYDKTGMLIRNATRNLRGNYEREMCTNVGDSISRGDGRMKGGTKYRCGMCAA